MAACAAEFSIFTSITRLHGARIPGEAPNSVPLQAQCDPTGASGGPIEPWVLGDEAYLAVKAALVLSTLAIQSVLAARAMAMASVSVPPSGASGYGSSNQRGVSSSEPSGALLNSRKRQNWAT